MKLGGLHHLNIRCAPSDLPAIEKFYGEVLGLKKGQRPNFNNLGIWLYDGDHPIVHVSARCPEGFIAKDKHNSSVDHVAFRAHGAAQFQERLQALGIAFEQQNVPQAGYQIFLRDPLGTTLEFNFPNEEAPKSLASGTMAARQTAGV
jgi:catechol 2,3-dioxygenase-like lactoylglutathione lyase family enzyme